MQDQYSLFESLGGYEVRRANIAERDQDYVLSLYRWLVLSLKKDMYKHSHLATQRLLKKIFLKRGTSGHRISIEAVIERLWRNYNAPESYQKLSSMLGFFEKEMEDFFVESKYAYSDILFRLRNFILMLENHIGDSTRLAQLINKQNGNIKLLASNPEYFQMILDFKTYAIEANVNNLELNYAHTLAEQYQDMIKNYKECWKLLIEEDKLDSFDNSRANIKAEMIMLRTQILIAGLGIHGLSENIDDRTQRIEHLISHPLDKSRLNNYKIMYLLKQKKPLKAFEFALSVFDVTDSNVLNYFDLLWFMKALNDAILSKELSKFKKFIPIVDFQYAQIDSSKKGHPIDLLWREYALFELIAKEDKSAARKYIRNSKNTFTLAESPISKWLWEVIEIHYDYINGKIKDEAKYFQALHNNELVLALKDIDNMSLLEKIRYLSPY